MKKILILFIALAFLGCSTGGSDDPVIDIPVDVPHVCDYDLPLDAEVVCTGEYLAEYPDVALSEFATCPRIHFYLFGVKENRDPCPKAEKEFGSYRGVGHDGRVVFRWSKPGDQYPAGTVLHYLVSGSEAMHFVADPGADHKSWDPNQLYWASKSKHDGKLVVMLPIQASSSYNGYKKGDMKGAWLEY